MKQVFGTAEQAGEKKARKCRFLAVLTARARLRTLGMTISKDLAARLEAEPFQIARCHEFFCASGAAPSQEVLLIKGRCCCKQHLRYTLHVPPKRNLRVTKWIGQTPAEAACSLCSRTFKVPINALSRVAQAQENLQQQFTRHKCQKEEVG
jgi:hypothetical protein